MIIDPLLMNSVETVSYNPNLVLENRYLYNFTPNSSLLIDQGKIINTIINPIESHPNVIQSNITYGYQGEFPDKLWSARYQFQNMYEIPILFYLLCLIHINLNIYTQFDVNLAWGFVIFRFIHFLIRLQNQRDLNIRPRTLTFVLSLICLTIGWINLFISTILA